MSSAQHTAHQGRPGVMDDARIGAAAPGTFSPPPGAEWNADPTGEQPVDPQVWVDRAAALAVDNIKTIRGLIERHRDSLKFAEVAAALRDIDDARSMTLGHLGLIADRPLVCKGRLI